MGVAGNVILSLLLVYSVHALPMPVVPDNSDNTTMDLAPNGMPLFVVDLKVPTYEDMSKFGKEEEDENMEAILRENANMKTGVENIMIEGDVILGYNIYEYNTTQPQETAARNRNRRWPNGVVPYFIDNTFDSGARNRILAGIQRYHQTTCIRWVPRTNQRDYVHIVPRQGCYSSVGRQGGRQELSVGGTCTFSRGTIMHELMHAIGFQHEQTRTDRDQFVTIFFQNIQRGLEYNFQRYSSTVIDTLQTRYDYASIMHYPRTAFSRNGQATIVPRQAGVSIGNRNDFSATDVLKINRYYECEGSTGGGTGTTPTNNCADNNVNCGYWAGVGECQRNPAYMNVNCRRSCRLCTSSSNTITTQANVCSDSHERCMEWANAGECQRNPSWMLPNCELSCEQCVGNSEACADRNENCDMWAQNGECAINPGYMNDYCKMSCGLCGGSADAGTDGNGDNSGAGAVGIATTCLVLEAFFLAFLK